MVRDVETLIRQVRRIWLRAFVLALHTAAREDFETGFEAAAYAKADADKFASWFLSWKLQEPMPDSVRREVVRLGSVESSLPPMDD